MKRGSYRLESKDQGKWKRPASHTVLPRVQRLDILSKHPPWDSWKVKVAQLCPTLWPHGLSVSQSVQSLSHVQLFVTPWITARQASLSITNSRSSLKLTYIESVMSSSYLIFCCLLLLLPPIPPSIRVFSNESTLRMRWPKYWSFSFSIIPSKELHPITLY